MISFLPLVTIISIPEISREYNSAADEFPTRRQRTSPLKNTIEQWLEIVSPALNQTSTRIESGVGEVLQTQLLTQKALDELESTESFRIIEEISVSQSFSETQSEARVGPTDLDYKSRLRARKIPQTKKVYRK
jgi:hypothetical protein